MADNLPVVLDFSVEDRAGALGDALRVFRSHDVSLAHLESRPSRVGLWEYDFTAEFAVASPDALQAITRDLASVTTRLEVLSTDMQLRTHKQGPATTFELVVDAIPWFPRKLTDLDSFAGKTLSYGAELDAEHPGFKDAAYRKRRSAIAAIALNYRT